MNILDNLSEKYSPPKKAAFAIYSLVSNQKVLLALRRARVPRFPQFRNTSHLIFAYIFNDILDESL